LSIAVFFVGTLFCAASAQISRTITVTGTVVDSATGAPVPGALVLLLDTTASVLSIDLETLMNSLGNWKLDSAFSGADGSFSGSMSVSSGNMLLVYGVLKQGYQFYYFLTTIPPGANSVNIGTIRLKANDASAKDTITVSGKVVDSVTNQPIGGALVAMSGLGGIDTAGNRVLTNTDGTFSKQVIISKLNNSSIVAYVATAVGYTPKVGQGTAANKVLDVGTILLVSAGSAVVQGRGMSFVKKSADRMAVYSLTGKLLYAGPVLPLESVMRKHRGAIIVDLKRNSTVVERKKIFPLEYFQQ
jgi:hypothetical protein